MKIYASRPEGNAFAVMGRVHELLSAVGRRDEWPAISERMISGDYANLCAVANEVTFGSIEVVMEDDADED